ncbi:MAG: hypothetical protein V3S98_04780 [Dehalococcoidia bacterium]
MEGLFLVAVGTVFIMMLVAARGWPAGAALYPTVSAVLGLPLLGVHVVMRIRGSLSRQADKRGDSPATAQILDIGFDDSRVEPGVARMRTLRMVATTTGLFVGIWLFGFHLAIPVYVFTMLATLGRVRWWRALFIALSMVALMIVAYDVLLNTPWNDPVVFRWFRA